MISEFYDEVISLMKYVMIFILVGENCDDPISNAESKTFSMLMGIDLHSGLS
jgi:hypothetical protein